MKKEFFLCALVVLAAASCSKDELLVDLYEPEFKANPFLTSNYCREVVGEMVDEQSAIIYTGMYGLYTEDDFKTFHYNKYEESIPCFGKTVFFDGLNVWTIYHESALGWILTKSIPGNIQAKEVRSYHVTQGEFTSSAREQIPTVIGADEMIFSSYLETYPQKPYQIDVYSFINDKVTHLSTIPSDLYPHKIFALGDKFFLLAKKEIMDPSQSTIQSYVYVSSDALEWDGPFLISGNDDIVQVNAGHGITTAFSTDSNHAFISMDDGKSWAKAVLPLEGSIQDIDIPEENLVYAVIAVDADERHGYISRLVKSADGGSTWQTMEREFYGDKISFYNKQHGMAMAKGTLQVTHDAGGTWKLVLVSSN